MEPSTFCRSHSDPTYGVTSYSYDALGRKTQVVYPPNNEIATTTYTGAATEVQDEGNGSVSVTRVSQADGLGHMISVCEVSSATRPFGGGSAPVSCGQDISATGFLTSYSRDAMGNLLGVTQSGLYARSFVYDSLSRLTSATNPESGTKTYTYDGNNNVLTRTAPLPNQTGTQTVTTTYTYDKDNRLTVRSYSDNKTPGDVFCYDGADTACTGAGNPTSQYPIGRLTEADGSGRAATWNSYDQMGRVATQWQCVPEDCGTGSFTLSYTYDYLGNMLTASNGEGVTISYAYDEAGHLTTVASSLNDLQHPGTLFQPGLNQQYNAAGELESALLGNGLTESYQYNARLRLLGGSIGTAYSFWVGYANDGVVTSSQDTVNGNWTYTYDNFNRLATSAESNQLEAAYNYQYDRFGNRWQQNLTAGSGYNSLWSFADYSNQISNSAYVTYDAAGNITWDDANTYTYDAENRIISVMNSSGTYTYNYDALGHRVQKTVGGVGLNYLYDLAGREVTRVDTQAGWVSGEVYAGAQHLATYGGSTTTFDHSDWLGTERYRTTATGGFAESCQSLVFGDGFSCSGSDASVLHFTGKEHDAESNLENFGARYYNSRYARFVTPDWSAVPAPVPYADLTNPQTLNQYVIVHDNPNTFADLDGHDGEADDGDGGTGDSGGPSAADFFMDFLNALFNPSATGTTVYTTGDAPGLPSGGFSDSNALAGAGVQFVNNSIPRVGVSASATFGPFTVDSNGNTSFGTTQSVSVTGAITFNGPHGGQTDLGSITVSTPTVPMSAAVSTNIVMNSDGSFSHQGIQMAVSIGTPDLPVSTQANTGNVSAAPSLFHQIMSNPYISAAIAVFSVGIP